MSTQNTQVSKSAFGNWRTDPDGRDPDRMKPGEVKTYFMTPEELAKYKTEPYKRPIVLDAAGMIERRDAKKNIVQNLDNIMKEEEVMKKLVVDVNKMLEICRVHGTGSAGIKEVAKQLGLSEKQAENQIFLKKIRRALEEEKRKDAAKAVVNSIVAEKTETQTENIEPEHFPETIEEKVGTPGIEIEMPKRKLKPVLLAGETFKYELGNTIKILQDGTVGIEIFDLDAFIEELKEVRENREAV